MSIAKLDGGGHGRIFPPSGSAAGASWARMQLGQVEDLDHGAGRARLVKAVLWPHHVGYMSLMILYDIVLAATHGGQSLILYSSVPPRPTCLSDNMLEDDFIIEVEEFSEDVHHHQLQP